MTFLSELDPAAWPLWLNVLVIIITIFIVGGGAHWVVESAARIANGFGVSELVIGLTIVSLGTSAPEFAVTLLAAIRGQGDISIGNIVGSNIFNLGFILGGCAVFRAIPTYPKLVWRDGIVLLVSTLLLMIFLVSDLKLSSLDGSIFILGLLVYLLYLYKHRSEIPETEREKVELIEETREVEGDKKTKSFNDACLFFLGLGAILLGSHLLVDSSSAVARQFGVSDWVIGVTIVAAGTSAPEFATSFVGVLRGRYAISAGNLIGSDIFNILGVLGITAIVQPVSIDEAARMSLVALFGMVLLVLVMMRTGWRVSRREGVILLLIATLRWVMDFANRGI